MRVYATKGEWGIEIIKSSLLCGKIEEEFARAYCATKGQPKGCLFAIM